MELRMISKSAPDYNDRGSSGRTLDETFWEKAFTSATSDEYMSIIIVQIVVGFLKITCC